MIVRPLTQDFDWDQYVDVTVRAFGPVDEVMIRPVIEPAVAAGRCLGAFDQGRLVAGHRHEAVLPSRALSVMARPEPGAAAGIRRPGPDDAAEVLQVLGCAHADARDCGPVTWDETTMRRWLTRPGRYADTDRYAYLAPDGFLGYRWQHGNDAIFVERVVASSAATTRALWAVAASNSTVAGTVRAQVGPANSGRWDLTVRAGEGRLSRHRTVAPSPSPAGSSHAGRTPLALGARGLAALYAGTPVATLRRAGTLILADGGSQDADAALDGAFAATPFMLDGF